MNKSNSFIIINRNIKELKPLCGECFKLNMMYIDRVRKFLLNSYEGNEFAEEIIFEMNEKDNVYVTRFLRYSDDDYSDYQKMILEKNVFIYLNGDENCLPDNSQSFECVEDNGNKHDNFYIHIVEKREKKAKNSKEVNRKK